MVRGEEIRAADLRGRLEDMQVHLPPSLTLAPTYFSLAAAAANVWRKCVESQSRWERRAETTDAG